MEARLSAHPDPARAQAFRSLIGPMQPSVVEEAKHVFRALIARLNDTLHDREWLGGQDFGLADVAMAPFAERLEHLALRDLFQGAAARWSKRILARPSISSAKAPPAYRFPGPADAS
jgi:glutathione S-transferase